VLAGGAGFLLPALAVGAVGGILASANIAPGHCTEIFRTFTAGNIIHARELQQKIIPLNASVTSRWGVPALKVAMDLLGLYGGNVRRPLLPMDEVNREYLKEVMQNEGVIMYDRNH
jgi:4-hydroxy-2-oxoglutarate aldolase